MRTSFKTVSVAVGAALLTVPAAAQLGVSPAAASSGGFRPLTAAQARQLAAHADVPVIVLLKNQPAQARRNTAAAATRAERIAASQHPLRSELAKVHAKRVRSFGLVNAVAGTVSRAEVNRLATDPAVASVIPDSLVRGAAPATAAAASGSGAAVDATGNICPRPGKTMLEPEALAVTHNRLRRPGRRDRPQIGLHRCRRQGPAISQKASTSTIRTSSGPPAATCSPTTRTSPATVRNAPTSGGEAFLDASAIAAQGRVVHNVAGFSAHPLRHPCNLRIEGMAPASRCTATRCSRTPISQPPRASCRRSTMQ